MLEKIVQLLSEVAGIGVFAIATAEKVTMLIRRLKASREAREEPEGSEDK